MCVVSAIHDYGKRVPRDHWNFDSIEKYRELIKVGEEFDKAAGEPDCVDPEKEKLMKTLEDIEKRLQGIEGKLEIDNG